MRYKIEWSQSVRTIEEEVLSEFESILVEELNSSHLEFAFPCHKGDAQIYINAENSPKNTMIYGCVRCSCGKPYLTFEGTMLDGKINYSAV
jgi:hypothetical protein